MRQGVRVIGPDRAQLRWDMVDLDSQLAEDHRARVVWDFVEGLDLSAFYARIRARDDIAGRPATDPRVLLAVWLYATLDGVGSARAVDRLCRQHTAYRWLCGGAPINHDLLSEFRRDHGALLDRLLTQSLTGLIAEGLIGLEEVAIDGTKVRARAGRGSMVKAPRLERIAVAVAERVTELKGELEHDPAASGAAERDRRQRALRAAEERAGRIRRARQRLVELAAEQVGRAKTHAKEEAKKGAPRVSTSDPEVRTMRLPDGASGPAWNVQVATAGGFVVTIEPTDRRNDGGLASGLVEQITRRCGRAPQRLLADGTAITRADLVSLAERHPGLAVYSPPPAERDTITLGGQRKRAWRQRHEPAPVQAWRALMASAAGQQIYRRRKLTERAHAQMKNRGMHRFLVHGLEKVRAVCLLHALALNLAWADTLRRRAKVAQRDPLPTPA